jgi:hypothetical protein
VTIAMDCVLGQEACEERPQGVTLEGAFIGKARLADFSPQVLIPQDKEAADG